MKYGFIFLLALLFVIVTHAQIPRTLGGIKPGDLLTTSSVPGHAMKATDETKSHGAIIGKAMSGLEEGEGLVLVLVN